MISKTHALNVIKLSMKTLSHVQCQWLWFGSPGLPNEQKEGVGGGNFTLGFLFGSLTAPEGNMLLPLNCSNHRYEQTLMGCFASLAPDNSYFVLPNNITTFPSLLHCSLSLHTPKKKKVKTYEGYSPVCILLELFSNQECKMRINLFFSPSHKHLCLHLKGK